MEFALFRGVIYFDNVYIIQGAAGQLFSGRGHSGSLIVHTDPAGDTHATGLLFAGSSDQSLTFMIPIDKVLAYFNLTLVGGQRLDGHAAGSEKSTARPWCATLCCDRADLE